MRRLPLILLILLAGAALSPAYDFTALVNQGYVSDFTSAHVIDARSRTELANYCGAVERSTGVQLAFVTIDTLEGEPIEDVANAIFRKWGIGSKKSNEGALVLLAVRDRRLRLEVGYGLEPILPDGFDGSLLRSMRPALRAGNYGEALLEAAHTLGARLAQAKGVAISDQNLPLRAPARRPLHIPWIPILLGLGFVIFLLSRLSGPRGGGWGGGSGSGGGGGGSFLTGVLLGNLLSGGFGGGRGSGGRGWDSGSSGGSSSGGFGGFDSGGGFGGFGGGDSGGGGASSDW